MLRPQMEENTQVITKWLSRITTRNTKEFREGIALREKWKGKSAFGSLSYWKWMKKGKGIKKSFSFIYHYYKSLLIYLSIKIFSK